MIRRFITTILGILLLAIAAPLAPVHAQGMVIANSCVTQHGAPGYPIFDPIASGLWAGVNIDPQGLYTSGGAKVIVTPNGVICIANPVASSSFGSIPNASDIPANPAAAPPNTNNTMPTYTPTQGPMGPMPWSWPAYIPSSNSTTNQTTTQKKTTAVASPTTTSGIYVAMGDSVAAGLGLSTPVQVPSDQTHCGRTTEAYPNIVATSMNAQLLSTACSGATLNDVFNSQLSTAFSSGTPKEISITAGANDAHWSEFLSTCYFSNCSTAANTASANAYLVAMQSRLISGLNQIASRSGQSPPTVVITSYYNPISSRCTILYPNNITSDEVTWMTGEVNALNQTLQQVAAAYPFAHFAAVDFTGHDICSPMDSWVQGPSGAAPFHPTNAGQQQMAYAVIRALGR